ncbi:MAG: peptide chain release factor N(5)-glutamine methyltransferase [Candidatus Paceibacterota bacterium]|jgi:release factor glutamine methyltransferase
MAKRLNREIEWLKRDRPDYYAQGIKRLENGEPIDYVIGWKEFLGCKIDLSAKPLIPREETEFWVGEVLRDRFSCNEMGSLKTKTGVRSRISGSLEKRLLTPASTSLKVLDLFSGSGCIGLAILKHCPNAHVTFAEKDPKLCQQIKKNLSLFPPTTLKKQPKGSSGRARVVKTDIFSNITGKFDVIFANPPYAATSKMNLISPLVLKWEPKRAILAGLDGLAIIKKFLKQAKDHLRVGGKIYLEFGFGQKLAIARLLKQFGYTHYQFNKDQFGKWRWVVIE